MARGHGGKTTLLRECTRLAAEVRRTPMTLDASHLDASSSGFSTALHMALNLPQEQAPLDAAATMSGFVLLIDICELLAPPDSWLRNPKRTRAPDDTG